MKKKLCMYIVFKMAVENIYLFKMLLACISSQKELKVA